MKEKKLSQKRDKKEDRERREEEKIRHVKGR